VQAYLLMLRLERGYVVYLSRTTGRVRVFKVERNGRALRILAERARQLYESLKQLQPPPPERGPWCRDCPYRLTCSFR